MAFATLSIIFGSISSVSAKTFADVNQNQTFYDAIEFLASQGIVKGYPDGTYGPAIILNRAEMVKIIAEGSAKYYALPDDTFDSYAGKSCFNDVKANQWYTKYVCYGKEKGWIVGYENGSKFKPEQKVTFVEGLKITFKGLDLNFNEESGTPWYKDLVNKASAKNYIPFNITGFNEGLSRDQMADMITRIIKDEQGPGELEKYLGDRADMVVTYETLEKGLDLSKMEVEEKTPGDDKSASADTVAEIVESIILISPKDPTRYVVLNVIEAGDMKNFKTVESLAGSGDKFAVYYLSSGFCGGGPDCVDPKYAMLTKEADEIMTSFKFGDIPNGKNIYYNGKYNFYLSFPDNWGTGTQISLENGGSYTYTITMDETGFSPDDLTIRSGDIVVFYNNDQKNNYWPATDVHPTHLQYPGSDILKCGTSEASKLFDACKGLKFEESFKFKFTQIGNWGYHDHINPNSTGIINVIGGEVL